jgi:hypothetical protein
MIGLNLALPGVRNAGGYAVTPGYVDPRITWTRAQADGARSTAFRGGLWREFGPDVPRFGDFGALIEGQRTNAIRNPAGEYASAPSFPTTTLPTHWAYLGSWSGGLTRRVIGSGIENGVPYTDFSVSGTPTFSTGGSNNALLFEPTTGGQVLSPGDVVTSSYYMRIVSGSLTNTVVRTGMYWRSAGGAYVGESISNAHGAGITVPLLGITILRRTVTAPASTGRATFGVAFTFTIGDPVDIVLRIGGQQLEAAPFSSTPIRPAPGSPAASTRGADLPTAALASLGIGANGACTVLLTAIIPTASPAIQTILTLDDGTANNRFRLFTVSGGSSLNVGRTLAGVGSSNTIATAPANTPFAAGVVINGAGRIAGVLGGGSVIQQLGGPTNDLTTMRLGANASGTENLFGEIGHLQILPYAVSDTELQARVAALPLT